jgi:5-methylcytosine-specific restriction endonuclease McrA
MIDVNRCLLLSAGYEPVNFIGMERAITMWFKGKVDIIEEHPDKEYRSFSVTIKAPLVVRLIEAITGHRNKVVKLTRKNIVTRDDYRCQYCAGSFVNSQLTIDHVIPKSQGGKNNWENMVTACKPCNSKKDCKTPHQAKMTLIRKPSQPKFYIFNLKIKYNQAGLGEVVDVWKNYLFV